MRQFIDVTGKTEDEAIQNALRQLGLDRDDVSVEILERAKSGFLGLGSCPAKVRVSYGPEEEEESCSVDASLDLRRLLLMAVATSIDALAVGVTFAFLDVSITFAITVIGVTTFVISLAGVVVGNFFGARYKKRAEISGGVILILLGAKILLQHLGIF